MYIFEPRDTVEDLYFQKLTKVYFSNIFLIILFTEYMYV